MMDKTLTIAQAPRPQRAADPEPLAPGQVLASRFRLEHLAGRGGMGTVYRAMDLLSGQPVALKVLGTVSMPSALQRFTREAELLASLHHPGIVSHVAHGVTEQGLSFLAMQWLEGEDLAHRLARQPLELAEVLAMARRVAEALAAAHHQGIVHRDIKPSNLFLRHGSPADAVLLDFGLARNVAQSLKMTASNVMIGTPAYMAPEQVSGQSEPTPATDIFSLGCVLYECLVGQPPFSALHCAAVLAKILFAEPKPLQSLRPDVPEPVQAVVHRMMAKDARQRPADAQELLDWLQTASPPREGLGYPRLQSPSPEPPSGTEQHLVSLVLASPPDEPPGEAQGDLVSRAALRGSLRELLAPHGATVELMADGSLMAALLLHRGTATDQAALAARCALSVKERWPEATVVVATGRGMLGTHRPSGEVVDRAGQLLLLREQSLTSSVSHVLLDEVSAGLLGPDFQLSRSRPEFFLLQGENLSMDASRPLLGKPTPCVGREQELALLGLALDTCVGEPMAQAMLVLAPAGVGKSRLRHEFLQRLERRGTRVLTLLGRGDPMGNGTAGGLLGQALRRLCGIAEGDPLEVKQGKLQRLARHLPPGEVQGVLSSLGWLCGVPLPQDSGSQPHQAHEGPTLLSGQLAQALKTFFRAECQQGPVLLILEDLHWGDALSVKRVDELLRALKDQPLLVLALARPEVRQLFPHLWSHCLQEITLRAPGRKACAALMREVLGPDVAEPVIDRLVEQSAGNMLFLEELIRGVAEGRGENAPETVLAMLQARLSRLESMERQVLRAASIFGRTFWAGGVKALLRQEEAQAATPHTLQRLMELEIIQEQPASRFPSERECRFHHALVRDAAYALVPDGDKPMSHRLAGAWLEQAGERDPRVLAEHASAGHQPERAISFYTLAVEQLMKRHALMEALRCAEAALALGPGTEERNRLRALQTTMAFWLGNEHQSDEISREVLPELRAGSFPWCKLMGGQIVGKLAAGASAEGGAWMDQLSQATPDEDAREAYLEAGCIPSVALTLYGARSQVLKWLERMNELTAAAASRDIAEQAWPCYARGFAWYHLDARPWQCVAQARQSRKAFQELGWAHAIGPQVTEGVALIALGDLPEGLSVLRESLPGARLLGEPLTLSFARIHLALMLSGLPEQEHQEAALSLITEEKNTGVPFPAFLVVSATALARVAMGRGELSQAEAHARQAFEPPFCVYHPLTRSTLSAVLRAQGRVAEARLEATLGVQELERIGGAGVASVGTHLALAEACFAAGDTEAGEASLRRALKCLHTRAADVPEGALRERFLHQVPENARALGLARQRWGESWARQAG
jgi:serine/threonine protein kinase